MHVSVFPFSVGNDIIKPDLNQMIFKRSMINMCGNRKKKRIRVIVMLAAVILLLNSLAWLAPILDKIPHIGNWCDWYVRYITPVWVNIFSRITGIFPFSIGELMILAGIVLIIAAICIGFGWLFFRKKGAYRKFAGKFYVCMLYIILAVCLVMTLNCTILYHCSSLNSNPELQERNYTIEELEILRNYVVEQCNTYSMRMERDENGYVVYDKDMQEACRLAMQKLSGQYPRLAGYYPKVKHMMFSNLMSQAYMAGYYFPFSMEANCNGNMYILNYPETYCHELAHLHGYIYEDEANFLAFLACISSGDDFLIYSGYLSVLNYIDSAYWESLAACKNTTRYELQVQIDAQVNKDNIFLLPETWEAVEAAAIFDTEAVEQASDTFTETSLNLNGVEDGMASYGRVVALILHYYDGVLYG